MPTSRAKDRRDQRAAARFDTTLPVHIGGKEGTTGNISAHGIYFEADVAPALGSLLNFSVEFTLHGQQQRLLCEGKVVRTEKRGNRFGVAARLVAPFFEAEERVAVTPPGAALPA
jgi:hypothetical protein